MVDIKNVFFREKPVAILLALLHEDSSYPSVIAKKVDVTYSHAVKLLQLMEDQDLLVSSRNGRIKMVSLTQKGRVVAQHFFDVSSLLRSKI